jgi:hypothetical protein
VNEKEPTQRTDEGLEIPVPTRKDWDARFAKIIKPADGPQEVEDAAEQEAEYPADETGEG